MTDKVEFILRVGEFQNGVFTLKTDQMFSVHITPGEFKNASFTAHFGFLFEENLGWEIIVMLLFFEKLRF